MIEDSEVTSASQETVDIDITWLPTNYTTLTMLREIITMYRLETKEADRSGFLIATREQTAKLLPGANENLDPTRQYFMHGYKAKMQG